MSEGKLGSRSVDDATTIQKIESDGRFLRYFYGIDDKNYSIAPTFIRQQELTVSKIVCGSDIKKLMKVGAHYQYVYDNMSGRRLEAFTVDLSDCG